MVSSNDRLRVALIFGGRSGEHDVSVVSARSVAGALDPDRYEVIPMAIDRAGRWADPATAARVLTESGDRTDEVLAFEGTAKLDARLLEDAVDVALPILHGPYGEDGTIQGLFEMLDLRLCRLRPHSVGGVHGQGADQTTPGPGRIEDSGVGRGGPIVVDRSPRGTVGPVSRSRSSALRQTGSPRIVGRHLQSCRALGPRRRHRGGPGPRRKRRGGTRRRCPRDRDRGPRQRPAQSFGPGRSRSRARVLRFRGQIPRRCVRTPRPGAACIPLRPRQPVNSRSRSSRASAARDWLVSTSSSTATRTSSGSTRSTPSPASPPSPCTLGCGVSPAFPIPNCSTN